MNEESEDRSQDAESQKHRTVPQRRLMYVELKSGYNDDGPAWIGWVDCNRTGRTLFYRGMRLHRIHRGGIRGNHMNEETGEEYWVSGVKKNGEDRHWAGNGPVEIVVCQPHGTTLS